MGWQPTGAHGPGGVRAARVGHHSVVCTVFEPFAGVGPVGPGCVRRVPHDRRQPSRFPAGHEEGQRGNGSARGADDLFDGHIGAG
ncbi:hypothetical protein V501_01592 [Pseudogymnoascus sp. VKM F-4519 (FW-2642)]|nr:hypothetical protein V501_01592 [Pseudogymnoascus sp. VKM F-4519 (FW-2642)]